MSVESTTRTTVADCLQQSRVNDLQVSALVAAAETDRLREPHARIGIEDLLCAFCRHGHSHWLDPWVALQPLTEILTKYLGPPVTLRPIVSVLKKSCELGLSPHAVATYVVLPRISGDLNWRQWAQSHVSAIQSIVEIIRVLRKRYPFNQDVLTVSGRRVLTDVFLLKYVGYPLSALDDETLGNADFVDALVDVWSRLELDQYPMLMYLRTTVLPALRLLLRLPDSVGLIRLIETLPEFEQALTKALEQDNNVADLDISLYGKVPGDGLHARRMARFRPVDYLQEYLAYQQLGITTLQRSCGVSVLQWLANTVRRNMSVQDLEDLNRLMNALYDHGSRHIYTWHAMRLLERSSKERDAFVGAVRANGGVHPVYPHLDELFQPRSVERERQEIASFAEELGLKEGAFVGHRQLLEALVDRYPAVGGLLKRFRQDVTAGRDAQWTAERALQYDQIIDAVNDDPEYDRRATMHALLLRSVIRGLGKLFSTGVHSMSFAALLSQYSVRPPEPEVKVDLSFDLPLQRMEDLTDLQSTELHRRVHFKAVKNHWNTIRRALTEQNLALYQELGAYFRKKGEQLSRRREQSGNNHKSVRRLQEQYDQLRVLLDAFPDWSPTVQSVAGLVAAAYFGGKAARVAVSAIAAVVGLVGDEATAQGRINYLLEDILDGRPTLRQLSFLITFLEDLIEAYLEDPGVQEALTDETLERLVAPYIKTRKNVLDRAAVDAAWRKVVQLGSLQIERSNWQQVAADTAVLGDRYTHAHRIYISRTPMDSYYGDMGGICLSGMPEHVTDPEFHNIRLVDMEDEEVVGMGLLYRYRHPIRGFPERNVWLAFAFNPLYSLLEHLSHNQQLFLYLQYRNLLETVALNTGKSVLLPGVFTEGVVSNHGGFARIILEYERAASPAMVTGIQSFDLYYSPEAYSSALQIINPGKPETLRAQADLKALSEKLFGTKAV